MTVAKLRWLLGKATAELGVVRLDRGPDRLAVASEPLAQAAQTISIRRCRADLDRDSVSVEQVEVETLATEIQTGVQD